MNDLLDLRAAARGRSAGDYAGTIRAYYPYWEAQYRPYLLAALDAIPPEQLEFKPRPELLTARQILAHVAEAEQGWMHSVVEGLPEEAWVVESDDRAQGWRTVIDPPDHAALHALLALCHEPTRRWLDRSPTELGRVIHRRLDDGSERSYTLHWILDHVQEHEIHHRAQLNLYLRLLGIEPPSI